MSVIEMLERGTKFELFASKVSKRLFELAKTDEDIELCADTDTELWELFELAKLGASRQWVPVTERLPEVGKMVDIWFLDECGDDGRIPDLKVYSDGSEIYFDDENKCQQIILLKEVSHWRYSVNDRPLPDGPGEGE